MKRTSLPAPALAPTPVPAAQPWRRLPAWCCVAIAASAACAPSFVLAQQPAAAMSAERSTIEQLRATTMALLDALDRQQQQSQQRADLIAQQAVEQQRVTTMALIEVLVGQGLLPRDRAETLLRMAGGPVRAPGPAAASAPPMPAPLAAPMPAPSAAPLPPPLAAPMPAPSAAPLPPPVAMSAPLAPPPSQSAANGAAARAPAGASAAPLAVAAGAAAAGTAGAAAAPLAAAASMAQWGDPPNANRTPSATTVRVPFFSETARAQIRDQVRNDVLATIREENWASPQLLPPWVRGVRLFGDLRVRAQGETYPDGNLPPELYREQTSSPAWSPDINNTSVDRNRLTLRARLGLEAKISEDVALGLRLSTGTTSGPTSSSQTLGTGFNKASLVLDRAWLRWEPWQDLRVLAGRMSNPFFGTDLLWADDLGFDGIAVQAERTLGSGVYAFASAGAFPLEEFNTSTRDKWLFGAQFGVDWSFGSGTTWRTALAIYDFRNVQGVRETTPAPTGPLAGTGSYGSSQYAASLRLKGNTLININDPTSTAAPTWGLASRFRPINLTTALTVPLGAQTLVGLSVDWVKNGAFDVADIQSRAGVPLANLLRERTSGLQLRGQVGSPQLASRGDWQVFAAMRQFERDAWIDGFTDNTWNLGGTNYRGWMLGGHYAFDTRTSLGLRVTSTRNLDDGFRSATGEATKSSAPLRVDVLQLDLNSRF